jgi:serine/threonine-protein kinase PRP4
LFIQSRNHFVVQGKDDGLHIERNALHDNWDDADGYYSKFSAILCPIFLASVLFSPVLSIHSFSCFCYCAAYRFGELLDGRYEIIAAHGKGVFSTVVRAKDLKASKDDPEEVAIKIIRNNETM